MWGKLIRKPERYAAQILPDKLLSREPEVAGRMVSMHIVILHCGWEALAEAVVRFCSHRFSISSEMWVCGRRWHSSKCSCSCPLLRGWAALVLALGAWASSCADSCSAMGIAVILSHLLLAGAAFAELAGFAGLAVKRRLFPQVCFDIGRDNFFHWFWCLYFSNLGWPVEITGKAAGISPRSATAGGFQTTRVSLLGCPFSEASGVVGPFELPPRFLFCLNRRVLIDELIQHDSKTSI